MAREFRSAWVAVIVVAGILAVFALLRTSNELQPELLRALVAVEVAGEGVARVGHQDIEAGTPFELHAIVEARDWRDRPIYYTDAEALELPGGALEPASLRAWNRLETARVLWFTIEGSPPYSEVSTREGLERVTYREIFQADWPQAWAVPGSVAPSVENFLPGLESRRVSARFGTQRFHVRVEILPSATAMLPTKRLRSSGRLELESDSEEVASVTATLAWPLESLSSAFGLPQIEPAPEAADAVVSELRQRMSSGLSFSRLGLLRRWLADTGVRWESLDWRPIEINGEAEWYWGSPVRAGSKVTFLYEDRGAPGRIDSADLCLDFDKGATVRTLEEIFVGEGLIELGRISPADASI